MSERFEPRQIEKAAGALDGVNQPEDSTENLRVVRLLLKAHELDVNDIDALVRLSEEISQQLVHDKYFATPQRAARALYRHSGTLLGNGLILVAKLQI
jgi:hypothetical protein